MRFITCKLDNNMTSGIVHNDEFYPFSAFGLDFRSINEYITTFSAADERNLKQGTTASGIPLSRITWLAPIPRPLQDVICLGINYLDHAHESAKFKNEQFDGTREHAVYFSKRVNEASATMSSISSQSHLTQQLDYEVELGVILKKEIYQADEQEAFDGIFGYTIINDFSARDLQQKHKQFYFGKSLEGFCAMGPHIVSADEFNGIPELDIQSFVNGELRQNSNTRNMIFGIIQTLVELSSGMRLLPASIISMGTPKGVGMGFEPPRFLKAGDEVVCRIEKIGELSNMIV